jgi:hypothetical protein
MPRAGTMGKKPSAYEIAHSFSACTAAHPYPLQLPA